MNKSKDLEINELSSKSALTYLAVKVCSDTINFFCASVLHLQHLFYYISTYYSCLCYLGGCYTKQWYLQSEQGLAVDSSASMA